MFVKQDRSAARDMAGVFWDLSGSGHFRGEGMSPGAGMGLAGRRPINTWARPHFLPHLGQGAHRRVCPAFTVALCSQQPLPPSPGGRCCLGTNALYGWAVLEEAAPLGTGTTPQNSEVAQSLLSPGNTGRHQAGSLATWDGAGGARLGPRGAPVIGVTPRRRQPGLEGQRPPSDPTLQDLCWGVVPSPWLLLPRADRGNFHLLEGF